MRFGGKQAEKKERLSTTLYQRFANPITTYWWKSKNQTDYRPVTEEQSRQNLFKTYIMPNNNYVYCGTVTQDGTITSNGNFSCTPPSPEYTIDYNGNCTNPVPVVSLTSNNPMLTYVLNAYASGFKLYIYEQTSSGPVPAQSSFDFIVGEII